MLRLDGQTINYAYDTAGRLTVMVLPRGTIQLEYDHKMGHLNSLTAPEGGALLFTYDGHLPTQETWTGEVSGSVGRIYDNNFRVESESVNGTNIVSYVYDNDSLLIAVGDLTLSRDSESGLYLGSTLGSVADVWSYNGFGESTDYTATVNGSIV